MNNYTKNILSSFLKKAVTLFVIWQLSYIFIIKPEGSINRWLTDQVVVGTTVGLSLFGYSSVNNEYLEESKTRQYIYIAGEPVVLVADECNGLELMALFAGFILAFPGAIKHKLWTIPLGMVMVYVINVIREIVLALNYKYYQESFHFNHKYTYVLVVYLFVFVLWRFWLNKFSTIAKKSN